MRKEYIISRELVNEIAKILAQLPYGQVAMIANELARLVQKQDQENEN